MESPSPKVEPSEPKPLNVAMIDPPLQCGVLNIGTDARLVVLVVAGQQSLLPRTSVEALIKGLHGALQLLNRGDSPSETERFHA